MRLFGTPGGLLNAFPAQQPRQAPWRRQPLNLLEQYMAAELTHPKPDWQDWPGENITPRGIRSTCLSTRQAMTLPAPILRRLPSPMHHARGRLMEHVSGRSIARRHDSLVELTINHMSRYHHHPSSPCSGPESASQSNSSPHPCAINRPAKVQPAITSKGMHPTPMENLPVNKRALIHPYKEPIPLVQPRTSRPTRITDSQRHPWRAAWRAACRTPRAVTGRRGSMC